MSSCPRAGPATPATWHRRRPETTLLYEVVRDNLETLYGAIEDGAVAVRIPKHARRELEAYLGCGMLSRGFARFRCGFCGESRIVAFSCKGRGFCPSCLGRRMCATAANLIERVLPPETPRRQWVLTFPFSWRRRLAQDGALLARLDRIFVETVHALYVERAAREGATGAKTGSVTVVQRSSADMRLNPHLHAVFLDGAWHEEGEDLPWRGLGHLRTSEVGEVLLRVVGRIERHLRRKGLLRMEDEEIPDDPEANLAASAVSGAIPPAGPQWRFGLPPPERRELAYDKQLCASLDGFTLHAATRAGGLDIDGREALLRYVLRPPLANERVVSLPDGLVRIILKRAFADGTVAVDMDPLSLLCRLAASVPPPRHHTVIYAGVLAAASPWRPRLVPPDPDDEPATTSLPARPNLSLAKGGYRSWAELLKRTFGVDGLDCPKCHGRMKFIAMLTEMDDIVRYLTAAGEATELPRRSPNRGPPYWASTLLRRQALGHHPTADSHDDDPA